MIKILINNYHTGKLNHYYKANISIVLEFTSLSRATTATTLIVELLSNVPVGCHTSSPAGSGPWPRHCGHSLPACPPWPPGGRRVWCDPGPWERACTHRRVHIYKMKMTNNTNKNKTCTMMYFTMMCIHFGTLTANFNWPKVYFIPWKAPWFKTSHTHLDRSFSFLTFSTACSSAMPTWQPSARRVLTKNKDDL